jgi:hypothetical protein
MPFLYLVARCISQSLVTHFGMLMIRMLAAGLSRKLYPCFESASLGLRYEMRS